jgi:hypothetical protein
VRTRFSRIYWTFVRARKLNIKSAHPHCDAIRGGRQIRYGIAATQAFRGAARQHRPSNLHAAGADASVRTRLNSSRSKRAVSMIFAFVAGIILGIQHSEPAYAAGVIATVIAVKTAIDVAWDKVPILGLISPFVVYRYNLTQKGEATAHAWVSYALQMMVFGMALGLATYALFFFVFTPSA